MEQEQTTVEKEVTIILNENEKSVLLQLIDLAVKSGGLNVAEAALHLVKKINS